MNWSRPVVIVAFWTETHDIFEQTRTQSTDLYNMYTLCTMVRGDYVAHWHTSRTHLPAILSIGRPTTTHSFICHPQITHSISLTHWLRWTDTTIWFDSWCASTNPRVFVFFRRVLGVCPCICEWSIEISGFRLRVVYVFGRAFMLPMVARAAERAETFHLYMCLWFFLLWRKRYG